jgi:predicted acylesterase/phospholipase RssA
MPPPQLAQLWSDITAQDVYRFRFRKWDAASILMRAVRHGLLDSIIQFLSEYRSLHDTTVFKSTLRKILSGYYNQFAQSQTFFAVSVTNLGNGRREYFYKVPVGQSLPDAAKRNDALWEPVSGLELLLDALIGSTALPVLFPPNESYFDGGVLLNQPITPAILLREPDILYVVIPTARSLGRTDNVVEIGQTVLSTWISASLISQLSRLRVINQMRKDRRGENEPDQRLPICVIRPPEDLTAKFGVNLLSFGVKVRELVNDGKAAADERLNRFNPSDPTEATWYDV